MLMLKKSALVAIAAVFAVTLAHAQASATAGAAPDSCEAKAVGKNGKPLAGAAKASFLKKCKADTVAKACETKAVGSNGKPLAGAAKASFVKKCKADAAK
ncbi:hypothetical protein [Trinickia caryophylli]|uniref:PsiF repeat-containing protein n=1 Tax=Trinickia caryophylli TaxID=28094 RepID=A0A1X7D374_TRICW|nr:hypothetical protein Busp01_10280 [Trinickia caryophylli]SMF07549.1 hypothetical protein SAMN06295900_102312 [Trinickia caryophylli]